MSYARIVPKNLKNGLLGLNNTMKFNDIKQTKASFAFQLIHDVSRNPSAKVDDLANNIADMKFKEMSVVIPPYMYKVLLDISVRNVYGSQDDDDLILHIIDEWLNAHKYFVK
jgi:bifunctional pyridoxal-dependent enzyme with beta-cystathionase and maltose regulon repressor activities